ncbi:VIT1/CCC1 transporter family protein [Aurantimicrobium minutum]|uniref:VIT1/CCC1 transporter family protein n=1 Tax=Aurantimicrobium minutum TaxID=708131 RepID=UPI00247504B7|nr:VIT1/CCC1 transporter family protein [Aurantimicrobium minutum]MDH6239091.1 VIT1/CCC1 family predicted Fe2+/Mn2+ transporter [Aurantimicrobium minutum]
MISTPLKGADPHEYDHSHPDLSGGWLRASVFGAMDGLVSNIALIAGIGAAGASPQTVVLTGAAGLVAGAFSMALGEYASVKTSNEQVDSELEIERQAHARNPQGEENELVLNFIEMGMTEKTAQFAASEVHQNSEQAARIHITQELGVDPDSKPSPWIAAMSSFAMFAAGAFIPLIPYALGFESLWLGLATGGVGLLVAGGIAARFTRKSWWKSAVRQLFFGAIAVSATYLVGSLLGVGGA